MDDAELSAQVHRAILDVVRKQADSGIDVVSDGEMGKTQFYGYVEERLSGFTEVPPGGPQLQSGKEWGQRRSAPTPPH